MPYSYCRAALDHETLAPRPCGPLESKGVVWGWTTPLQGPQLVLRPLWPPGVQGSVTIDRPDGEIVLCPVGLDPQVRPNADELLRDIQRALPEIATDWASCLIDAGGLKVQPTTTGCLVTVHPKSPVWRRTTAVPVPWRELIGSQDPLETLVFHEEQGPVALVGGRDRKMPINLAEVMWPGAFTGT
jgi:hypothetical protein